MKVGAELRSSKVRLPKDVRAAPFMVGVAEVGVVITCWVLKVYILELFPVRKLIL